MNTRGLSLLSGLVCLVVVFLSACTPSATPAPTLMPSPTARPTVVPTPLPGPMVKPLPTAAPVSFAGKTITLVVPLSPGGAGDIAARIYAKDLGRFLPGSPTVIVRNIPGGGTTIGANYAYLSKPDGQTILLAGGGTAMADLLDNPALKFSSLTEMTVVVAAPARTSIFYFKPGLFDKPEDVVKAKGIIYGDVAGSGMYLFACTKELIGIPTERVITAYGSGSEARRALLSGEINGVGGNNFDYADYVKEFVKKGEMKILAQTGIFDEAGHLRKKHPALPPDILTVYELYENIYGKSPSGLAYEALKSIAAAVAAMPTPLFLPPGTPDNIKTAYWIATQNMVRDPGFRKNAEAIVGVGEWFAGENSDKLFRQVFSMKPEVRQWLSDLMSAKYGMVLQ